MPYTVVSYRIRYPTVYLIIVHLLFLLSISSRVAFRLLSLAGYRSLLGIVYLRDTKQIVPDAFISLSGAFWTLQIPFVHFSLSSLILPVFLVGSLEHLPLSLLNIKQFRLPRLRLSLLLTSRSLLRKQLNQFLGQLPLHLRLLILLLQ
ncbi:hypothetical protein PFISCL1PPCAC_16423 [Pristionchus fissidentatus]|uniref:G protein-coupled receptor n=1 Tax=Pristionchus fissidentatus TaxID=1538716 RepID=A0AAV5VZ92_9BILA|nr:hypothetical protein PFISCL1PPCAC_16423 [Pristionchus fissidentatus]